TVLLTGDKIGSKLGSWAEIEFSAGHQAKLGPNSFIIINEMGDKTSLEIFKGDLFSKVRKLSKLEKYEITTPQSVASVKGTEFTVEVGDNTIVIVHEGSVLAKEMDTGGEVVVHAGKYTLIVKSQAPTEPDDIENLEEVKAQGGQEEDPAEEEEEAEEEMADEMDEVKEELRAEIKEAVADIKVDVETVQEVVEQQKENDASTGRTLRDIHGNLVRVEQYVLRPKPDIVQFINITKRGNYKYKGVFNVKDTGARLDKIEFRAKFNTEMPEKISDWLAFFDDIDSSGEDFYPEQVKLELESRVDDKVEKVIMTGEWDLEEGTMGDMALELKSEKMGTWLVDIEDYEKTDPLYFEAGSEAIWDGMQHEEKVQLWMISPKVRIFKDKNGNKLFNAGEPSKYVRMGTESWLIDNEGKVYDFDYFAGMDGSSNPFEILRNIAFETSMVCRYGINNSLLDKSELNSEDLTTADYSNILSDWNDGTDFFYNNLDIIATPDFIIPVLEEIAKGSVNSM
ncbi:FecR domain-containing protein, partial [Elusimicrobiota bacterium]